jgi:hypothetical protein
MQMQIMQPRAKSQARANKQQQVTSNKQQATSKRQIVMTDGTGTGHW